VSGPKWAKYIVPKYTNRLEKINFLCDEIIKSSLKKGTDDLAGRYQRAEMRLWQIDCLWDIECATPHVVDTKSIENKMDTARLAFGEIAHLARKNGVTITTFGAECAAEFTAPPMTLEQTFNASFKECNAASKALAATSNRVLAGLDARAAAVSGDHLDKHVTVPTTTYPASMHLSPPPPREKQVQFASTEVVAPASTGASSASTPASVATSRSTNFQGGGVEESKEGDEFDRFLFESYPELPLPAPSPASFDPRQQMQQVIQAINQLGARARAEEAAELLPAPTTVVASPAPTAVVAAPSTALVLYSPSSTKIVPPYAMMARFRDDKLDNIHPFLVAMMATFLTTVLTAYVSMSIATLVTV
jgi:hypothetical protein